MTLARACLAALLLIASGVRASAEVAAAPRDLWAQVASAHVAGNRTERDQRLQTLLSVGRELGLRRFPIYAESAAALAIEAHERGDADGTAWGIRTARSLDPDSAAVDFAAAEIARQQGRWGDLATSVAHGVTNIFATARTRTLARHDLLLTFLLALALAAALLAVILFLRYWRVASHDFRELIGTRMSVGAGSVVAFALLFLPLFLWLGPLWLLLYWLMLFFSYASTRERALIAATLAGVAVAPLILESTAYRLTAIDSPVIAAALAAQEHSYEPEATRRLREFVELVSDDPRLHLLLGNLEAQSGNDQQAAANFRKAIELDSRLAGAHLNLGNYHFLLNDTQAAILSYEKAAQADPKMAIADYNRSVASGDLYKFAEQGSFLEQALQKDRALIDRLRANPPAQKVVQYQLPMSTAWSILESVSRRPAARDVYGNFGTRDLGRRALNPLTIGAVAALLLGAGLAFRRRKSGVAGECIKCGRTFCSKCKSSRESATYCTQCIHIYLKRDGVSLETKKLKLEEVQQYQTRSVRRRKIVTTLVPGSAQMLGDATVRGFVALLLFVILASFAILVGRLAPVAPIATSLQIAVRALAATGAIVLWLVMAIPTFKLKATS